MTTPRSVRSLLPSSFPQTHFREAHDRLWLWPVSDLFGWSHPLEYWPPIQSWIEAQTTLSERNLVLQAGGCCGLYPALLARIFSKVLTFEPDPSNFQCLVANCANPRIIPANFALSDKVGMVDLLPIGGQTNVGCIQTIGGSSIPSITIDSLSLERLDAMVLDLEGYEERVLYGAEDTLFHLRPKIIVVETCPDSLILWMRGLNYTWNKGNDYDSYFTLLED